MTTPSLFNEKGPTEIAPSPVKTTVGPPPTTKSIDTTTNALSFVSLMPALKKINENVSQSTTPLANPFQVDCASASTFGASFGSQSFAAPVLTMPKVSNLDNPFKTSGSPVGFQAASSKAVDPLFSGNAVLSGFRTNAFGTPSAKAGYMFTSTPFGTPASNTPSFNSIPFGAPSTKPSFGSSAFISSTPQPIASSYPDAATQPSFGSFPIGTPATKPSFGLDKDNVNVPFNQGSKDDTPKAPTNSVKIDETHKVQEKMSAKTNSFDFSGFNIIESKENNESTNQENNFAKSFKPDSVVEKQKIAGKLTAPKAISENLPASMHVPIVTQPKKISSEPKALHAPTALSFMTEIESMVKPLSQLQSAVKNNAPDFDEIESRIEKLLTGLATRIFHFYKIYFQCKQRRMQL